MTLQEIDASQADDAATRTPAGVDGILRRLSRWLDRDRWPSAGDTAALFTARLTDVAANRTARSWAVRYLEGDEDQRRRLLAGLAEASARLEPRDDAGLRLFRRLYAQAESLQLLVELRADMLRWRNQVAGLVMLESELAGLLSSWFDVGMLELRRISWDSPASLLEKLIRFEAVHEIQSWEDLRNRVADHRRCYAFFHPRMEGVPLIFVEVAFTEQMADNVQALLDPEAPLSDPGKMRWAIFYSISNTQSGLRGISFGNFLLKRVVEELLREFPRLKSFATLSPMPGFSAWLARQDAEAMLALLSDKADRQLTGEEQLSGRDWLDRLNGVLEAPADDKASEALQRTGLRLAARYLKTMKNDKPLDVVARFHLGNGARIERLNWAADTSPKGQQQSCAMMANYLYDLDELDENLAQLAQGKVRTGRALRWL
ncbi:MAG: malonyl-CoA decarboxylase family protein [Castellaniella sp.]